MTLLTDVNLNMDIYIYIVNVLIVRTIQRSYAVVTEMLETAEVIAELSYMQWALAEKQKGCAMSDLKMSSIMLQ